nr:uncharacterized protein LOC128684482 [Cherax quadricarinatus]
MSTDSTLGDKALSLSTTKIFRFKTILIGLIYFSFGVFLYQTIRWAVEKRVPSALITTSSNTGRRVDGADYQAASLLHTLNTMPEVAVEAVLLSEKGSEVWVRQPPCLPVYLGHLNLFHQHQPQDDSSNLHHSAVSSVM